MSFEAGKAQGIRLEGHDLTGGAAAASEANTVEAVVGAEVPAAPTSDVAEADQLVLEFVFEAAAPVSGPWIKRPACSGGDTELYAHGPEAEAGAALHAVGKAIHDGIYESWHFSAISSSGYVMISASVG